MTEQIFVRPRPPTSARVRLPRFRLMSVVTLALACSSGSTTISVEDAALGTALIKAGVLTGRVGGFGTFAMSQITKDQKLTLVSDAGGATAEFDAVAVLIVWDLRATVGQFEIGWYNGVVAWNGLNVANQTVDRMVTIGAAGSGNVVQSSVTTQIPVLVGNVIGESLTFLKPTDATYVGTSGSYTAASANFGTPRSCARPIDTPTPVSCLVSVGTISGSFNYGALRFAGTGGNTLTQPSVSFNLPAIQVIISAN